MSCLKKYRKVKYLGKGSYGAAILVELRSNPSQMFVIKEIVIGHLKLSEQNAAKMEAEVLHQMSHSNITMYIESFVENSKLYIVMEHADGGDLTGAIAKRRKSGIRWPEDEVMRIFVQLCLALKHVHEANILHRDLKAQNVFLTTKGIVKLGDFGIAKVLDADEDQARTQIGTPYYLSPEICESKPYGRKSDVWSLGVILFELLTLEMPFQATSLPSLVHLICSTEPPYNKVQGQGNTSTERYSNGMLALVKSMLHKDPDRRPSVKQLVTIDIMRVHISRLLSYTLKAGNGGVGDIKQISQDSVIDSEEADRNIEKARIEERHRANEKAERDAVLRKAKDREAHRVEEREKLKKFRSEMVRKKEINRKIGESENDEVRVLSVPEIAANTMNVTAAAPSRVSSYQRDSDQQSPKQQQQQQQQHQQQQQLQHDEMNQKSERSQSQGYAQERSSDTRRDVDHRQQSSGDRERERERERDRERDRDYDRELRERCHMYQREDEVRRNKLSECYDRDYRRVRELSQCDEGRSNGNSYNNNSNRNIDNDNNNNIYNNNNNPNKYYNNNNYNDNNYDGHRGSPYNKPDYMSVRLSHGPQGGYNHAAALYQGQHRRDDRELIGRSDNDRLDSAYTPDNFHPRSKDGQHMYPINKGSRPGPGVDNTEFRGINEEIENDIRGYVEYESAARKEFFANRAAALAVKSRIDENDNRGRDGGFNFGVHNAPTTSSSSSASEPSGITAAGMGGGVGGRGSERELDWNRDREREQKEQSAMHYLREAASKEEKEKALQLAREIEIRDAEDPAVRVALIKAQKERDREKLAAEQAYQLQLAHEAQREERKRAADRRLEREREEREEREGKDENVYVSEVSAAQRQTQGQIHTHRQTESVVQDVAGAVAFSIDFTDIAPPKRKSVKIVENISETDFKAHPRQRKGWGPPADLPVNVTGSPSDGSCTFERGMSHDQLESESPMDESLVLKRLEDRKEQHQKAREQAKEVFRKLREQRLQQVSAGKLPLGSCMVRRKKIPIITTTSSSSSSSSSTSTSTSTSTTGILKNKSDGDTDNTNKSVLRSERLKDILGHVARAVESVDLAVDGGVLPRNRKNIPESKDVVVVEESEELSHQEEDELTNTIDRWLDRCLGNITVRGERKRNKEKHVKTAAENCREGDEEYRKEIEQEENRKLGLNSDVDSVNVTPTRDDSHSHSTHRDVDHHDDEMAGLQFMLAKELMSMGISGEGEDACEVL